MVIDVEKLDLSVTLPKRFKRVATSTIFDGAEFAICEYTLGNVIAHYLSDRDIYKQRYKKNTPLKKKKLTLPKVAGLISSAILRYRPIFILSNPNDNVKALFINSYFALDVAEAICCNKQRKTSYQGLDEYLEWKEEYLKFSHSRNYTTETNIREFINFCRYFSIDYLPYGEKDS